MLDFMRMTAVLLAAGGGTRFAGSTHKLLAALGGTTVFQRSLDNVVDAGFAEVVVVTGAVDFAIDSDLTSVTKVHNPLWADGQAGSLHAGLNVANAHDSDHAVVGLADQPFVGASAWRAIAGSPSTAPIVVATYGGVRGPNPVRLHSSVWPLIPTVGDEGARSLMRLHPDWIDEVACDGSAADIDTLEDLRQWTSS
jgi:CTP:molybdopterin cytidylyltransferase MocA